VLPIVGATALAVAGMHSAKAQPSLSALYFGGSLAWTHHTGYVPDKNLGEANSVEHWLFSGKVFGGYRLNEALSLEVAYHHLGKAPYWEGFGTVLAKSAVRSWAISSSLVYVFPALPALWIVPPSRVFVRGGLAYKNILQETIQGAFEEGTLSAVIGIGIEHQLTQRWFSRLEVEHLSVAIGGPVHSAPLLKGLLNVNIGGTSHVPNVMHTQLMLTLGYQL
jgi:hypothetical protein